MTGAATPVLYPETASMGYRDKSNYEPFGNHGRQRPARPYNWVQWTGVAFGVIGIAIDLAYLFARAGWVPQFIDSPAIANGPLIAGMVLINSRLEPVADPAPELAPARKRWLVIIVTLSVAAILAATVAELLGA